MTFTINFAEIWAYIVSMPWWAYPIIYFVIGIIGGRIVYHFKIQFDDNQLWDKHFRRNAFLTFFFWPIVLTIFVIWYSTKIIFDIIGFLIVGKHSHE